MFFHSSFPLPNKKAALAYKAYTSYLQKWYNQFGLYYTTFLPLDRDFLRDFIFCLQGFIVP